MLKAKDKNDRYRSRREAETITSFEERYAEGKRRKRPLSLEDRDA
jgi:hypothetical protein